MASLLKITEDVFNCSDAPLLFNDGLTSRCFGLISEEKCSFRFGWQSDIVEPLIINIREHIVGIGIDQHFSIINFNKGSVLLNLKLNYNFHSVESAKENLFIATELEIIRVNKKTLSVIENIGLPDIAENIRQQDNDITVSCMDGSIVIVSDSV